MAAAIGRKLVTFGFGAASGSVATQYFKSFYQSTADEDLPPPEDVEPTSSPVTKAHHPRKPTRSWNYEHYKPTHPWNHDWDNRAHELTFKSGEDGEEEQPQPVKRTKAIRHLYLIRHGQYNLKGETDQERTLTDLGIKQAESTGRRLAELNLPLTSLMSSTMTRAIQTANLIRASLSPDLKILESDSFLREGGPYPPEPISRWSPEVRYHEDGARIEAAFRKHFHRAPPTQTEDSYEVIVCHANVIRYFFCRALQLPPEAWLRISLKHASITYITIRPDGRVGVRALGDSGHIEPSMLTSV